MSEFIDRLKKQAEENPIAALGVGAFALTAVTKAANALVAARNSKTWKKEVARRMTKLR